MEWGGRSWKVRGGHQVFSFIAFCLVLWSRISHWMWRWLSHLGCPCSERLRPTHLSLNDGIAVPRGHVQLWRKYWGFEILSSRFYNKRSYALNHVFPHLWRMNFQKQYEVRQKAVYHNCSRKLFNFSSYIRWRVVHRGIQRQPQSSTCTGAYVHACMNMNTHANTQHMHVYTHVHDVKINT